MTPDPAAHTSDMAFNLASTLTATLGFTLDWGRMGVGLLLVGFIAACAILILIILIQKPQGGGLAGAFGSGSGSGQTAFGTRTGDALTWITVGAFVLFVGLAIAMNYASKPPKAPAAEPKAIAPATTTPASTTPAGFTPAPSLPTEITPAPAATVPVVITPPPTPAPAPAPLTTP